MEPLVLLALLGGGLIAGIANAIAGGGSLLTLPLLVFAGLPIHVANGTNRVAVAIQGLTAAGSYAQASLVPWKAGVLLLPATLLGSLAGAGLALILPETAFRPAVAVILLGMAALLLFRPQRLLTPSPARGPAPVASFLTFFAVAAYGGFIQAGVGFFYLAALIRFEGLDALRANGLKTALVLAVTLLSLALFGWAGTIDWGKGLLLSVGMGAGGFIGAKLAIRGGNNLIRWVLVVTNVASAVYLLRGLG